MSEFAPEELFVKKFVIKEKHERYLGFLQKEKSRRKFTKELYHFMDFEKGVFREVNGIGNVRKILRQELGKRPMLTDCYVISDNEEMDGKRFALNVAIDEIAGKEATILIFGHCDLVYYEAEAFDGSYISF